MNFKRIFEADILLLEVRVSKDRVITYTNPQIESLNPAYKGQIQTFIDEIKTRLKNATDITRTGGRRRGT